MTLNGLGAVCLAPLERTMDLRRRARAGQGQAASASPPRPLPTQSDCPDLSRDVDRRGRPGTGRRLDKEVSLLSGGRI